MSYTLSLEERLDIADEMGAKLNPEDWSTDNGQSELSSFLDDLDVPRHTESDKVTK